MQVIFSALTSHAGHMQLVRVGDVNNAVWTLEAILQRHNIGHLCSGSYLHYSA